MVGAIVLFILALVAGIVGVTLWGKGITTGSEINVMQGLTVLGIGAVALTGALVIDGIRFYATRVSQQLEWILRRGMTGSEQPRPSAVNAHNPLSNVQLGRFRVIGKSQETGAEAELVVQALDQTSALRTGEKAGLEVIRVEQLDLHP